MIEKIPNMFTSNSCHYPKERSPPDCSFARGNRYVPSSLLRPQHKGSHFDCNFIAVVLLKTEGPFVVSETDCLKFVFSQILQHVLRPRTENSSREFQECTWPCMIHSLSRGCDSLVVLNDSDLFYFPVCRCITKSLYRQ